MPDGGNRREAVPYYVLFFLSGFPALLYQIVWQRALFSVYGVNIESVTVIVTVFMLGLGIGSLAGGKLSKVRNLPLLAVFGGIELGIALFGICSLSVFHWIASFTAGASAPKTGVITFALLLLPTMLMGSTLPLLVYPQALAELNPDYVHPVDGRTLAEIAHRSGSQAGSRGQKTDHDIAI